MTDSIPRLRMFAGPNGSGKSTTIRTFIQRPAKWYGIYLNADDIEKQLRDHQYISLADFGLSFKPVELIESLIKSLQSYDRAYIPRPSQIQFENGIFSCTGFEFDSYHAAALTELLRYQALEERKSFTFETVMSHPSKVEFLAKAMKLGYRTYLYFVATEDPSINIRRVQNRVSEGGHSVPEDKIRSRYTNSIELLESAIRNSDRAFLFDTSEDKPNYFAEITNGLHFDLKTDEPPVWFLPVMEKFIPSDSDQTSVS